MAIGVTNFPTSLDTVAELIEAANNSTTTLNGALDNSTTTITVASTSSFPSSGTISIDSEIISYTGKSATQFTGCTRAFEGTSAASHSDGATVDGEVTARHHNVLASALIVVETKLGYGSSTSTANTVLLGNGTGTSAWGAITNAYIDASAAIAHSKMAALTASRLMVTDASGFASTASVTSTEAGYLSGVTSAIQTQIDGKQAAFSNQNANIVYAGPATGAAAAPAFRSLVAADLPDISSTYLTVATAGSTYLTISNAASTYQPVDTDLTAIAALSPTDDDIIQRKAGAWTNRTMAQLKTDLSLSASDVGLGNVENTALSTWGGSSNITTLGTVTTGTLSTGAVIGGVTMTLGSDGTGDIYYRSAGGVLTRLAAGTNGHVLTLSSGLPAWQAASGGGLTVGTTAIASGTAGRILYETSGNVLGEIAGSSADANGAVQFASSARTSGVAQYFRVNTPADTTLTASTESVGVYIGGNGSGSTVTRQWATGALTTQREYVFVAPTYAFAGASTLTTAATVAITGAPTAGTNATITYPVALQVQSGQSLFPAGSKTAPSISFGLNVGFYNRATTVIGLAAGSGESISFFIGNNAATNLINIGHSGVLAFGSGDVSTTATDTGLTRLAGGVLRASNASTGAGKLVIGSSSASSSAADLYVVGSSASLVPLRVDSAATPSVDVFQVSADNGTTTHFKVTSTGAPSAPGAGANSERFGSGSTAAGASAVSIGNGAVSSSTGTVAVGQGADATGFAYAIAIGQDAQATAGNTIAIGAVTRASASRAIMIGNAGITATLSGGDSIIIGGPTSTFTHSVADTIILGYTVNATTAMPTTAGEVVITGNNATGADNLYMGLGRTSTAPTAYTINGTGGSGTNIAGADLQLAGGKGTGTGAAGKVSIQTAPAGTSGSSLNTLVTALQVDADTTAGNTRLLIYDVDNATLERVTVGAADSGGSGFKVLRIPN